MRTDTIYGITQGDASGVGPEILLKAYANREIGSPFVAYGDLAALQFYNERLGYGVALRSVQRPEQYEPGVLNVLDLGLMKIADMTPGKLSRKAGQSAREYVVAAPHAALAREIAAIVTLPMN